MIAHAKPTRGALVMLTALLLVLAGCGSEGTATPPATIAGAAAASGTVAAAAGSVAPPVTGGTAGTIGSGAVGAAGGPAPAGGTGAQPTAAGTSAVPVAGTTGGDVSVEGGPVGTAGSADWAMMGYDLASSYFNKAETKLTKENAGNLKELWVAEMGGNVYGAPLQIGDTIYGSAPGSVRAFEAATGKELWRATVASTGSLAHSDGILYLNTNAGQIAAIDAADGKILWTKPVDAQASDGTSSPLVVGEAVVVGGSNGGLELSTGAFKGYMAALDRKTGAMLWNTRTVADSAKGASIWSSPSADLTAGLVFGSTGNNYGPPATDTSDAIIAFDLKTGEIKWKNQRLANDTFGGGSFVGPDADFGANPVLYETMVGGVLTKVAAAGTKGGTAHAVKRDDGMLLWTRTLGTGSADGARGIFTNSTWSGKNLLVALNEGGPATLFALDGATGEIAWMRTLPGQVWGRMSVANGVGFVGTGTALEAFDVDTGTLIKSYPSKGGTVAGTITIANGRVAFGEGLSWSTNGRRGTKMTVLAVP